MGIYMFYTLKHIWACRQSQTRQTGCTQTHTYTKFKNKDTCTYTHLHVDTLKRCVALVTVTVEVSLCCFVTFQRVGTTLLVPSAG